MHTIVSLIFTILLILSGPELLGAKTAPQPVPDLETATVELQENTKDLRRNITSWRKIQGDAQLSPAKKKIWRDKAKTYLRECEAYNVNLDKVDAKKLPNSELSRRFLLEKQTFQRELQYFQEILQEP
jgi:hypothetical protein